MSDKQPDIIWIVADQLHHQAVGYAGNTTVKTPNIDRLAESGLVFENAYCQQPLCMPSRCSFNTGYYPQETRVHSNPVQLPDTITALPDRLSEAGYHTAAFGHIGGDGLGKRFDTKVDLWNTPLRQSMMAECDAVLPGNKLMPAHSCGTHPVPEDELFDVVTTNLAVDEINSASSPLFLQLDFFGPHAPWYAPQKYIDMYDPDDIPLPQNWNESVVDKPTSLKGAQVSTRMEDITESKMREALQHYYARISMIDARVGRVLTALEERGNLDNTAIMFFADHGDYAGEFGMIGKNRFLYDCLTHVPLVVHTGSNLPGERGSIESPAGLIDLAPTSLELAGVSRPEGIHGDSLLSVARNNDYERAVFSSYLNDGDEPVEFDHEWDYDNLEPGPFDPYGSGECWGDGCIMVRRGDYKLISYSSGAMELFNLDEDPRERNNLYGQEGYHQITHQLMVRLLQWQMNVGLPDIPQDGLPYHFRGFVKRRLPETWQDSWESWQKEAQDQEV